MGNSFFKNRIRQLREARGLTMEQLAAEIGVTKSRVNMWENNGAVPRQDVLLRLSQFFSVSIDSLLGNVVTAGLAAALPVAAISSALGGAACLAAAPGVAMGAGVMTAFFGRKGRRKKQQTVLDELEQQMQEVKAQLLRLQDELNVMQDMLNAARLGQSEQNREEGGK